MGNYVTIEEVRVELGFAADDTDSLSDADAGKLRRDAEAAFDSVLGPYPILETGEQAGRKISEDSVEAWRWEAVTNAILAIVSRLDADPNLLGPDFSSVSGPEFSRGRRIGPRLGANVQGLIDATGLVPTGARAAP